MLTILAMSLAFFAPAAAARATTIAAPIPVPLPDGKRGIGFDDLFYSKRLGKVVVPAGRTGKLDLIDVETRQVTSIRGFTVSDHFTGAHDSGITSADEGDGLLYTTDRTDKKLYVVDPKAAAIVASAPLAGTPDYVRFIPTTHEAWVTEPDSRRIEIFQLASDPKQAPKSVGFIDLPRGGPEALAVDVSRGRVYTHLWHGSTMTIDIKSRKLLSKWPNGCKSGEGVALDDKRGLLVVGCIEGRAAVLDLKQDGKMVSELQSGSGVDIIAYSPERGHVYFPGSSSATLAFLNVADDGHLSVLGKAKTTRGAHCGTADDRGGVWVCDIHHGRLLYFRDPFPAIDSSAR